MSATLDDDDFDDFDEPVTAHKTGAHGDTDKLLTMEEERIREDVTRVHQAKMDIIVGAVVLVILSFILGLIAYAMFFGPSPQYSFTPATHRDLTTPNNTGRDNDTAFAQLLLSNGGVQYEYHHEVLLIDEDRDASGDTDAKLFCQTSECRAYVRFLEDQLDPNHDACGNLYDHVCSRWKKRHEKLASERGGSVTCVDDIFAADYQHRLIALLLNKGHDSYGALRNLFQDCVNGRLATEEDVEGTLDAIMAAAAKQ
ncbi:hypothetical protein MTO96_049358 [Rhipicephalus appendiculatus]